MSLPVSSSVSRPDNAGFTLKLGFEGLCAFVPRDDAQKAWVFLVDESAANEDVNRKKIRQHHAILTFPLSNLKEFALATSTAANGSALEPDVLVYLKGCDIHILPDGKEVSPPNLNIAGLKKGVNADDLPIPEVKSPSGSFAYLSCLEKACRGRGLGPGGGAVLPELLGPTIDDGGNEGGGIVSSLAARVFLTSGKLSVASIGVSKGGDLTVWRYKPYDAPDAPQDHRQMLGSKVMLEIHCEKFVTFRFVDYITGEEKRKFSLVPFKSAEVVASIKNEESERFLGDAPREASKLRKSRKEDRILESYFKLTSSPPCFGERPIPVGDYIVASPGDGGANSSPPCSPARLSSVAEPPAKATERRSKSIENKSRAIR